MFRVNERVKKMSGLERMKKRIGVRGETVDDRIVKGKYKSFQAALKDSYQAETITLLDDEGNLTDAKWRCLINPSRLTEQFDKKILSIDYEAGMKEGDVFYWDRTQLYWLINLQQHTEEAYFRATITRAEFEIEIEGKHYWAILAGPDETTTDWNQKHNIWFNDPNLSMSIEIAKDSLTVNYFTRHKIVKMKQTYPDVETGEIIEETHNWKVVATDKYSSDKTIQVYLEEYFDNSMEDAMQSDVEPEPAPADIYIDGPSSVQVFDENITFSIVGLTNGNWLVSSNKVKINSSTESSCDLNILASKSGKFNLIYKTDNEEVVKEIKITSF